MRTVDTHRNISIPPMRFGGSLIVLIGDSGKPENQKCSTEERQQFPVLSTGESRGSRDSGKSNCRGERCCRDNSIH